MFLRHGETRSNYLGVACGGDCVMPLVDTGRQQIREAALMMSEFGFVPQLIFTAGLKRTRESAEIIQAELNPNAEILIDSDINERSLGQWNGQSHRIINPLLAAGKTPENGESRAEFRSRVMRFFNRQIHQFAHWPLIIGSRGNARLLLEMVKDPDAANLSNGKMLKVNLAQSSMFEVTRIDRL